MDRRGKWIQTYTGRQFWPLDPRPEDVCINDIAHALGNICRYGGHCKEFYSVAQHSIYVSFYVPPAFALFGLLHDASEAYLLDFPTPIKDCLLEYSQYEAKVLKAVFECFDIFKDFKDMTEEIVTNIKFIDNAIKVDETLQLMKEPPEKWDSLNNVDPLGIGKIECLSPKRAKYKFLDRFQYLMKEYENEKTD